MKKQTITLTGFIRNDLSRADLADLRVEAWDRDVRIDDIVGSDVTDSYGKFRISIQQNKND